MKLGIVGLPNVGKSTLFNAITSANIEAQNYPFCTIDPNVGVVEVPDNRLAKLKEMYNPDKFTPGIIEFLDIAGLVKGASKGEGLGNKFLANIREVDAIVHVVRCFDNNEVVHVEGSVEPFRDIEIINLELIFSDIEMLERKIAKTSKMLKADKKYGAEIEFLQKLKKHLEDGKPARTLELTPTEKEVMKSTFLLTSKPVIYVANVSENDFSLGIEGNPYCKEVLKIANAEDGGYCVICAQVEAALAEMSKEDKKMFLDDLGADSSGLDKLIKLGYQTLGLISFLTAGKKEVKAWTINDGTTAKNAAGKIHSDIERGFIMAEVIKFDDLVALGSENAVKEKGLLHLEGKNYLVKDGDIINFRFNV